MRFRAPATTANLGPGFDCAGAALDLWNELELTEGAGVEIDGEGAGEIAAGPGHLGVQAFELLAPADGFRFRFHNGVPFARGLGSSAATIVLGLVAAAHVAGQRLSPEELLSHALRLESHPDNLAPAIAGGVTLAWDGRIARIADSTPLVPVAIVPESRVQTEAARRALPDDVPHSDAAHTAGRAALLGAALAAGDPDLFAAALDDRLHEPYRSPWAPALAAVRAAPPAGARGATISGSGPTVLVWADPAEAEACASELAARFPEARVLRLAVSASGAGLAG